CAHAFAFRPLLRGRGRPGPDVPTSTPKAAIRRQCPDRPVRSREAHSAFISAFFVYVKSLFHPKNHSWISCVLASMRFIPERVRPAVGSGWPWLFAFSVSRSDLQAKLRQTTISPAPRF